MDVLLEEISFSEKEKTLKDSSLANNEASGAYSSEHERERGKVTPNDHTYGNVVFGRAKQRSVKLGTHIMSTNANEVTRYGLSSYVGPP